MPKKCKHESVTDFGTYPKAVLVLETNESRTVPNVFVRYMVCDDCSKHLTECFYKESKLNLTKNENYSTSYRVKETHYTNGGSVVEKDGFGNYYYNGQKMTDKQLKRKLALVGDKFGDQKSQATSRKYVSQQKRRFKRRSIKTNKD